MFTLRRWTGHLVAGVVLFLIFQPAAFAQATRTWVSGVGDDANPCSRTAPCKTFAGAISKTAAGGEISVLDPGGYGGVTITKSITINNSGGEAGVLVSGTNAIVISAGAADRVTLRGLNIEGMGTGLAGIRVNSAAEVVIEDCQIQNFRGASSFGILVAPSSGWTNVAVRNSTINANGQSAATNAGIALKPTGSGIAVIDLNSVLVANNAVGMIIDANATTGAAWATVRESQIVGNDFDGLLATSASSGGARLTLQNSTVSNNGFGSGLATVAGVKADGASAQVRFLGNVITVNKIGVTFINGGTLTSYGGNVISANSNNGTFSSTQPTQ